MWPRREMTRAHSGRAFLPMSCLREEPPLAEIRRQALFRKRLPGRARAAARVLILLFPAFRIRWLALSARVVGRQMWLLTPIRTPASGSTIRFRFRGTRADGGWSGARAFLRLRSRASLTRREIFMDR